MVVVGSFKEIACFFFMMENRIKWGVKNNLLDGWVGGLDNQVGEKEKGLR